jgi:hypothetical protein
MRIIRIYTPEFQAKIDTYINEGLDAIEDNLAGIEELTEPLNRELIAHNVLATLEGYWFYDGQLPEGMGMPMSLEFPEFVTYSLEPNESGQPLIPSTLPENFTPEKMDDLKVAKLINWIEDEVPDFKTYYDTILNGTKISFTNGTHAFLEKEL